jgi:hypothetical protein
MFKILQKHGFPIESRDYDADHRFFPVSTDYAFLCLDWVKDLRFFWMFPKAMQSSRCDAIKIVITIFADIDNFHPMPPNG